MLRGFKRLGLCILGLMAAHPAFTWAAECPINRDQLTTMLKKSVKPSGGPSNGGFDNNEWAAVVDRNGILCAITFSGSKPGDQWPGSRAIALEKANAANGVSLRNFSFSTANLWGATQPGAPLFGLIPSNPVNQGALYSGDPSTFGSGSDPMLGKPAGGVMAFGGGLALYDGTDVVGGLGVSGDSSCADHNIAWRVREALGLNKVPAGVGPDHNDEIIYDVQPSGKSVSGYGHPKCNGKEEEIAVQIHSGYLPEWAKTMQKP